MSSSASLANVGPAPTTALEAEKNVVAFVSDEESASALRQGLAPYEGNVSVTIGNIRNAIRHLEKTSVSGMLIVDIEGVEHPEGALDDLARVCPPDTQVVVVGDNTEIRFYRRLIGELGVTEYMPKPLTRDSVQQHISQYLSGGRGAAPATRGGRVVVVCGARGGVGGTTIAVSLALELSRVTKGHVALLDLHLQNGSTAVMLGGRPGQGLRIALEDPTRADALFLERTAFNVNERLRLVAAEEGFEITPELSETGVARVLELLRQKSNYVVVDLPIPPPRPMLRVLAVARQVVVVLRPDVTGLRDAKAVRRLVIAATGSDRVLTVVNRGNEPGALSSALIREGLGTTPDATIPDLGKGMLQAVNLGVPATKRVPALRKYLAPIVREVAGIRPHAARGMLSRMFAR
jgi:pilus assembly protein CpaE